MKKIIVGLGNPGKEYEYTRHNAGFLAIQYLHEKYGFPKFTHDKDLEAEISGLPIGDNLYLLVKPQTFMNLSGRAVAKILNYYRLDPADATIIYDDIDLPLGSFRYRTKGSPGTHNGIRSIVQVLGVPEIPRIRLGIGPEHPIKDLSGFVLGRLSENELATLEAGFREITLPLPFVDNETREV